MQPRSLAPLNIFYGGVSTETNTFAISQTGWGDFEAYGLRRSDLHDLSKLAPDPVFESLNLQTLEFGDRIIRGLFAMAEPSGPTMQSVWTAIRDHLLQTITDAQPDIILLNLHGAMVSTGCDDCEGELVQLLRRAVGNLVAIGVMLDPHCHLTDAITSDADAVVIMKEYPHTDAVPRFAELYSICRRKRLGLITPVWSRFDCRMIGHYPTTSPLMRSFVDAMYEAERQPKVLSVSLVHGFPWGDTAATGTQTLVLTDGDLMLAKSVAKEFGHRLYRKREELLPKFPTMDNALDIVSDISAGVGPIVLADIADNSGGGAPGDNVSFLREIMRRDLDGVALGAIFDPQAVQACFKSGVGAEIALWLGGKCGLMSGDPMDVNAVVMAIHQAHRQTGLDDEDIDLGPSAWVRTHRNIDLVIISKRSQVFGTDLFTGLGIDLKTKRLIVVKSTQHFQHKFAPIAKAVIRVATPGAIQMNFADIPYRKRRDGNFHPRVANPLNLDEFEM